MLIGPEALWSAVLATFALSAVVLALLLMSKYVRSEQLWLAAVVLGIAAAPSLPYVLAAYYAKEGLPYDDALAAGTYAASSLFIFFVTGVAGARLSSSK